MPVNRSPRMSDVASLAGVATMTVSRVINGNQHVTEETRQRVFAAIETLNYRPNTVARSLREQRSRQIGIIVPNINDTFFATCAQAVSVVAKEHGYSLNIAMSAEDPVREFNEAILMMQRNIEGLIVIPACEGRSRLTQGDLAHLPIVTVDRPIPSSRFDCVVVKNSDGAKMAVEHLLQHGHRRIAFVSLPLNLYTMKTRHTGYCLAMKKAGARAESYSNGHEKPEMIAMLKKMIAGKRPVTAIFCGNNQTTLSLYHAMSTMGIRVPEDISVVGFDDFESADIINPSVTVVSQPVIALGREGANLLFSRILHKKRKLEPRKLVLPVELIVRNSCGCTPS